MANVELVILALVVVGTVFWYLRYHGGGIVARRGMSIGADLGTMGDKPRVRVLSVTKVGPDRVHLLLAPDPSGGHGSDLLAGADLDLLVLLREDEFGFELLNQWQRSQSSLAVVIPSGSRIVRLRSIDDLQPLTLSRVEEG